MDAKTKIKRKNTGRGSSVNSASTRRENSLNRIDSS